MRRGYNKSLYLLPFDHRQSYVSELLHLDGPLTADQRNAIVDRKAVIYAGFRQALGDAVPVASAGILVDEEFGADILRDAHRNGYVTALSTEKSGRPSSSSSMARSSRATLRPSGPPSRKRWSATTRKGTRRSTGARPPDSNSWTNTAVPLGSGSWSSWSCRRQRRNRIVSMRSTRRTICSFDRLLRSKRFARGRTRESSPIYGRSRGSIGGVTTSTSSRCPAEWPERRRLHRARPPCCAGPGCALVGGRSVRPGVHRLCGWTHHVLARYRRSRGQTSHAPGSGVARGSALP